MSDRTMQADPSDGALVTAIDRWSMLPELSEMLARADAAFLVLDARARRIVHASPAARSWRAGLAPADGTLPRSLNLSAQIGTAGSVGERPRLALLRLDPRGIARPVTCLVARAAVDGTTTCLILSPVGAVPVLRPLAVAPEPSPSVAPTASDTGGPGTLLPVPRPDGRLVWRSDADDVLAQVSGDEALSRALSGRSWHALFAAGAVAGEGVAAAIAERATFRALTARVALPGESGSIDLELSGAPSARPHQSYAGFSGFGLIRSRRPAERSGEAGTDRAVDDQAPAVADEREAGPAQDRPAIEPVPGGPRAEPAPVAGPDPEPEPASAGDVAALSAHEHAAFREIARTLGVRFAGDDPAEGDGEGPGDGEREAGRPEPAASAPRGSVTPFPAPARPAAATGAPAQILDGLPVGALVHRDATVLFANPRLLALTGFADLAALRGSDALAPLLRAGRTDEGETERPVVLATAAGDRVDVLVDRANLAWEGGSAELVLARRVPVPAGLREPAAPDAESRPAAETVGAEAALILDALPDGVLTLDEHARTLSLNARAAALLGRAAQPIVGQPFPLLIPAESRPAVEAALARAERGGTGEVDIVRLSERDVSVPLSVRVVRLAEGASRFCVTVRDRSEAAAGEAEIARQAHALAARNADFLAKISHEIRTPLNTILGFADVMLNEPYGPLGQERIRDYLRDIQASGSQTLSVVDDLLDLARIEAGRVDLSFTDIPLNDLVSGCIAVMQPQAARDRIVVRTSFAPDLKTLVADERSVRQAALTVIANAIRFTDAGGQVIVSTMTAERGEIALRVRDTGVGMTSEEVENALHPFDRIAAAGSAPGAGTGLGLTLTKALVEANHGRFRITSRKHEGTLVEMVFPAAQGRSA